LGGMLEAKQDETLEQVALIFAALEPVADALSLEYSHRITTEPEVMEWLCSNTHLW
jgi:hypothetical protein